MKRILYWILLGFNVLLAITLLISYLAVHISPGDFTLPAYFGLAYPYLLLINILMVIIWAMLLRFEAFISLVVILLGITHFSNYIKLTKPSGEKEGAFKLLSYNVRLFNYFETKKGSGSEKTVLGFIKNQDADIICLQEYFVNGDPASHETYVKSLLGGKYYSHTKLMGRGKNRFYGIATYSRFPIIRKGEIIHPKSSSLTIFSDVVIQKDTFRIYNNHLQSFRLKKMEKSLLEEMTSEEKETIEEVKSLSVSLKNGFVRRSLQAQVVKDHINSSKYPVIVAGDFNDTPVSYTYRKIRKGLNDSFVNSGYGAGFTYKGNYPPNRIDYILYSDALINNHFDILRVKYSDHYPIVAWLKKRD
ncbi:MAG: endonuclease/exonuclease/phosphatase family protein [Bacteroidetes bacterium]|nr:endonuclease/exonuclease/phosphatase family protein [Bacteroidota bacterium]